MTKLITRLGTAAVFCVLSMPAHAVLTTATYDITSANMTNLFSGTLDAPCTLSAVGEFFSCVPDSPAGSAVTLVNPGLFQGAGHLNVTYESTTGEIKTMNSLYMELGDLDITITSFVTGFVTIRNATAGPAGGSNDILKIIAGTQAVAPGNGTADPDQDTSFNTGASVSLFQHFDSPNTDVPDFSTFTDVVDTCTGTACALIPVLNLDGIQYQISGTVSAGGFDSLTLTTETSNKSSYIVALTTGAAVPVPAAVWLFGSALGLLGWARRRVAA